METGEKRRDRMFVQYREIEIGYVGFSVAECMRCGGSADELIADLDQPVSPVRCKACGESVDPDTVAKSKWSTCIMWESS